ncbi:hypothetical protein Q4511_04880 [Paracoccus sp. 1_MG-2023]|uniref:hypothetical protein n=1 Tax=unclassified Paracoccus (in: a-proteobacteria) TaxID=2688777 RepID=UPI001C0A0530|nr:MULTISPECIES: hypothetical protein [unclassified Paracoccus (in: a-proteobacteria)]MBU2957052.1 hypothetical protein [Paracoccus sp. C2R09]MDO6668250.1 hypothetical protein [Paracoccus sp. 1_MG-2023]
MKKFMSLVVAASCGLGVGTAAAAQPSDARLDAAVGYFQDICMGGGDLRASLQAFEASGDFGNPQVTDSGGLVYGSFTGPDRINGSVKMGFDGIADHCSIIVTNAGDPLQTSKAIALRLAGGDADALLAEPGFGDYPDGGIAIEGPQGVIFVAPLGTGASSDIVHVNFFPGK